ncbi:exocyst complex protein exo70 [Grosmannia clavigera kw1407]|uniref:Exocyst complex protein exo70 n=1 Tax=Grosmannia clavigera (strain kw1407 / UAMH 11150) TaxID=655863 RepID=F0XF34_GROCL|nr:exocyst complex protein exo70 [Grosmannia clavigera kw1407]EFX04672.1 exocyst complex protein exo70 [Grosmannia clavigera kw1407]
MVDLDQQQQPPAGANAGYNSAVLHRQLHHSFPCVVQGSGSRLVLDDGRSILDASGGAAVACIGHGDRRVVEAAMAQMSQIAYCATTFYTTAACEQLCRFLVDSTDGHMARAYIVSSGSEAMEAAMKLARQYFLEKQKPEPDRFRFIARHQSYHGITLGSLSVGGHPFRRRKFEPLLLPGVSHVLPCFAYRGKLGAASQDEESDEAYVARLAAELDAEFQRVGPHTVCAFVAEPVVGAALGAVPAVPGYFKAVRDVCHKYGALLILDEVMCGMGRTGTLHAWQQEDVVPDIQTMGKCLGGGYQPIAAVLASHEVTDAFSRGTGSFVHGHTYQGHPVACAAALAVQKIVAEEDLLANVRDLGAVLGRLLVQRLGSHANVGNIRGRGFFWGIEFVQDKATARPFPAESQVAMKIAELGLSAQHGIAVYPGSGTADGVSGDHIILAPPYNVTRAEVDEIGDKPIARMAVGLTASGTSASLSRHAAEEEARAEVDVLNSRLERTSQLTRKIETCLNRLDATGKRVHEVAGPLNGETKRLQVLGHNIDNVIAAIARVRQPADSKNDEEQIIRTGPENAGLPAYLSSIQRLERSLGDMKASNIRSTQQTIGELQRLIRSANSQLELYFDKLLRAETPREIEPLFYVTKNKPFPVLSQDLTARLGLINAHVAAAYRQSSGTTGTAASGGGAGPESPVAKIYAEVRGPYLAGTLKNLASASINTAKKKNADAMYRPGTNGISTYTQAMEGMFLSEYDSICSVFTREDWGPVFQAACQPALTELARTLRELNGHIKAHPQTDCYLAYEIVEIVSSLSGQLETRTGELKASLAAALKPVRETAKGSLAELLDDVRRRAGSMQALPPDGGVLPVVSETMQRLQVMTEFLRPLSSIMISLGDGGWRYGGLGSTTTLASLASFDVNADGRDIFAHYCADTVDALLSALDARARVLQGRKPVVGVFLANSISVVERMVRESELAAVLQPRLAGVVDPWRKKAATVYLDACKDVSMHLFDVIHTNRSGGSGGGGGGGGGGGSSGSGRPQSGQGFVDSASVLKGLSSKDRESIKGKFTAFNASFDELLARHRQFTMEREVRQAFARNIQQMLEPLYNRFYDRYHDVDKGRGKYVKYDKVAISAVFTSLYQG